MDAKNIYLIKLNSLTGDSLMSKAYVRPHPQIKGNWEVVGGGYSVTTLGKAGAENIAAK